MPRPLLCTVCAQQQEEVWPLFPTKQISSFCNPNYFFKNYLWKKLWHPQTSGWVSLYSHDVICHMSSPFKYLSNINILFIGQHFHFWKIYYEMSKNSKSWPMKRRQILEGYIKGDLKWSITSWGFTETHLEVCGCHNFFQQNISQNFKSFVQQCVSQARELKISWNSNR